MGFQLLEKFDYEGVPCFKFVSEETGLQVALFQVPGPLVNGYIASGTEARDDFGCPHTLEHLIFLGSEAYPFKGVLDALANRCLANGTNAWTASDHTCYTVSCAGSEGFLNLLSIYMDHILYPTITDSAFYTEIHHLNGEGENAGVVYCEMKAREDTAPSRIERAILRSVYGKDTGYYYETGGMCEPIRSLEADTVRKYHQGYYYPQNTTVIVAGMVTPEDLFKSLSKIENKIISKEKERDTRIAAGEEKEERQKPWSTDVPIFNKSSDQRVVFPSEDEAAGYACVVLRCPKLWELEDSAALAILGEYLSDSAISPLQRYFVYDVKEPYCGSISWSSWLHSEAIAAFWCEDVVKERMGEIKERFFQVMEAVAKVNPLPKESSPKAKEPIWGFDMKRMELIIQRNIRGTLSDLEEGPHDSFSGSAILDFLYGELMEGKLEKGRMESFLDDMSLLKKMVGRSEQFWIDTLKKFILPPTPTIFLIAEPSKEEGERLVKTEKERVKQQQEKIGKEGLKELEKKLKEEINKNEKPIPERILDEIPIPAASSISLFPVTCITKDVLKQKSSNAIAEQLEKKQQSSSPPAWASSLQNQLQDLPLFLQFDHIKSNFIEIRVVFDTTQLSLAHRKLLEVYLDVIFELPIRRTTTIQEGGEEKVVTKVVPYEEVVLYLESLTVSFSNSVGIGGQTEFMPGSYGQLLEILIKVEPSKYEECVNHLKEVLFDVMVDPERLKITLKKLIKIARRQTRNGSRVLASIVKHQLFGEESNRATLQLYKQCAYLKGALKSFGEAGEEKKEEKKEEGVDGGKLVCQQMEGLIRAIATPTDLYFQVLGNIEALENPTKPWEKLAQNFDKKRSEDDISPLKAFKRNRDMLTGPASLKPGQSFVAGVKSVTSGFLSLTAPGISDMSDPDRLPLVIASEILTTLEGPLWVKIRGQGLSYSYSMYNHVEQGLLCFSCYKAEDVWKAYSASKKIIEDFASGASEVTNKAFEAAKASLIFSIVSEEETLSDAALSSFYEQANNLTNPEEIERIEQVTIETVRKAMSYFLRLFSDEANICVVTSPPKVDGVVSGFKNVGREVERIEDMWGFFGLEHDGEEAEGEHSEDESGSEEDDSEDETGSEEEEDSEDEEDE